MMPGDVLDQRINDAINLTSGQFWGRNPHAELAWIRENCPIYWDPSGGVWGVSTYREIKLISRRPDLFCNGEGIRPDADRMPNPALVQLHKVIQIRTRNQNNLDRTVMTLGPFVNTAMEAAGSGRWFDGYLQNLIPLPAGIAPSARDKSGPASTVPGDHTLPTLP
jgi:hypothetical protein